MTKLLNAALKYAEQGFEVFPLTPLSKIPLKGTAGSKEATTDKAMITAWWTKQPNANIGLVTKKFLVLDIDVHDKDNDGFKSMETMINTFGELPDTAVVATANGGAHIYLVKPKDVHLPQKIAFMKGIDVKAHPNNYVVAPPSQVKRQDNSIGRYELKDNIPLAVCPQWLIDFILRNESKQARGFTPNSNSSNRYRNRITDLLESLVEGVEMGARNDTIARTTGQLLTYGVKIPLAWKLIQFMNGNSAEPLDQRELETTFLSICKKELKAN